MRMKLEVLESKFKRTLKIGLVILSSIFSDSFKKENVFNTSQQDWSEPFFFFAETRLNT